MHPMLVSSRARRAVANCEGRAVCPELIRVGCFYAPDDSEQRARRAVANCKAIHALVVVFVFQLGSAGWP